MVGLPFTVYCLPYALRSALSALRQGGSPKPGPLARIIDFQTPVGFLIGSNRLDRVRETETRRRGKKKVCCAVHILDP